MNQLNKHYYSTGVIYCQILVTAVDGKSLSTMPTRIRSKTAADIFACVFVQARPAIWANGDFSRCLSPLILSTAVVAGLVCFAPVPRIVNLICFEGNFFGSPTLGAN